MKRKSIAVKRPRARSAPPPLQELQDREAIRTLLHEMNWLADQGDIPALLDCFTDDLVYDVGPFGRFHGKSELRGFYERTVMPFTMRIHRTANEVIEVNGGRAKCRCYWRAELELNRVALNSSGHYIDELVRQRGRWKVSRRTATITYMCPLQDGWAKTRIMKLG
jgi:ketosteroid isomerase-like protein